MVEVSMAVKPNLDKNIETLNRFVMCIIVSYRLTRHR